MRLRMDQMHRPIVPDKIEHTIAAIETWERKVREYELRNKNCYTKKCVLPPCFPYHPKLCDNTCTSTKRASQTTRQHVNSS
eukprot:3752092-Amphidinium_carterae.1